ncbi:hypothetical protein [Streptomyces olivochromogenes]|uniref:Uncharacterized protein n=1 Tax=Streptomyces olivochromogenes TaxID=1963 RepID=A0A250VWH3_STROL|nr:hypothetical protein [Streptomyces olivochromogenes]KUN33804.1 hypothetical protein AQJ27_49880 [Streptomyces olivochromogenes]GAX58446.1 hypothetical protein SO3561_10019 [Streptomyces olivochromogenes]
MTDLAAVYGLIGALGGAILGAGATITAPVLLNRSTKRQQQQSDARAEFDRLMSLRRTTRQALLLLGDAYEALLRNEPIDPKEFRAAMSSAQREVRDSADNVERDGLRFVHTRGTPETRYGEGASPEAQSLRNLAEAMQRMTRSVCMAAGEQGGPDRETLELIGRQYNAVEQRRRHLLGALLDRMDMLQSEGLGRRLAPLGSGRRERNRTR